MRHGLPCVAHANDVSYGYPYYVPVLFDKHAGRFYRSCSRNIQCLRLVNATTTRGRVEAPLCLSRGMVDQ